MAATGEKMKKITVREGNLGHNEISSIEPEGRFWIVTYRTLVLIEIFPFKIIFLTILLS